jgi:ribosomal protein L37E
MRDLVAAVEAGLGPGRLAKLKRNPDSYQQFWLGVLEARLRLDGIRDSVPFLISNGYGAVRNMRRAENSFQQLRVCPECGKVYGNRTKECPDCGVPTVASVRHSEYAEWYSPQSSELDLLRVDLEAFVGGLSGNRAYVARRWLLDRADLYYDNHLERIAGELGLTSARAAQIKASVRAELRGWLNGGGA